MNENEYFFKIPWVKVLKGMGIGLVAGLLLSVAVLLIASFILGFGGYGEGLELPVAMLAMVVGAFISGLLVTGVVKSRRLVIGAITGAAFFLILFFCYLAMKEGPTQFADVILSLIVSAVSAVGGAVVRKN